MKKKLVLMSAALFLALTLSVGMYASAYTTATATIGVNIAAEEIATYEPAPAPNQPGWNLMLPEQEFDSEILVPNDAGDRTQINDQYPESGEHWDKVVSDDGDSSYVSTDGNPWKIDLYNIPDHSEEGTILQVSVYMVVRAEDTPSQTTARTVIKTNNKTFNGTEETVTTSYAMYSQQWAVNPETGAAWTWQEIDDLQIGVSLRSANHQDDESTLATQVYAVVDYELPLVIEGEVPSGELFTITPDTSYPGDLHVNIYITNTGDLLKALQYLNIKLYTADSLEADKDPDYQVLSTENGVVGFNMEGGAASSYTIEVTGGSYRLISDDPYDWGTGWSVTPEFYIEISQK